jgi:hypothetical protein
LIEVLTRNSGTCRFGGTINRRFVQSKRGMEYAGSGLCTGKSQAAELQEQIPASEAQGRSIP